VALTRYYVNYVDDLISIKNGNLGPFDEHGLPMVDYRGRYLRAGVAIDGTQSDYTFYTPVTITIFGLGSIDQYLASGDDASLKDVKSAADWLVKNLVPISETASVWQHLFRAPFDAAFDPPYPSAIAQAQGISFLLRAYDITGCDEYNLAAKSAYGAFLIQLEDGGVLKTANNYQWLEEWPSLPPSHVLNGFMFGILAVYDYHKAFNCPEAGKFFQQLIRTLDAHIRDFDTGYWTTYDLLRKLVVSKNYHLLHIALLSQISAITGGKFDSTVKRWRKYSSSLPSIRRALGVSQNILCCTEYRSQKLDAFKYKFFGK
jgi:heparosan-N-sulfate-glucuronate 5-epimerase